MGVDACIYVKTRSGEDVDLSSDLPRDVEVHPSVFEDGGMEGSTHEIVNRWRYYGPGYERGPWPSIAAVLMVLLGSQDVKTVWYFGDNKDDDEPFIVERLEQFTRHYIEHGNRPYDDKWKK